ncbi:MAG TPA: PH domain-containing protein [Candidatus Paceibacterota bacterium]
MDLFSFITKTSYTFEGKKDDETVLLFLHRHWFTLVGRITYIFLGGFIPLAVLVVFGPMILSNNLLSLFILISSCYYMALWFFLFYTLTMYTLETWIVTDKRIINSRQCGFFDRRISELSLHNIQDISVRIEGAIPTMMGYGDLEVQTAAAELRFMCREIPNPQDVKDEITKHVTIIREVHERRQN